MKRYIAVIAFIATLPRPALARGSCYGCGSHHPHATLSDVLGFLLFVVIVVILIGVISVIWKWLLGFTKVKITINPEAFKAVERIRATLPLGLVKYERDTVGGWFFIWIDRRSRDRLYAARKSGEAYSDTIIRLSGKDDARR